MKQAIKESTIRISKTDCAKLPDSVGFHAGGDSHIRRDEKAIIKEQKSNGLKPFRVVNGKIKEL